MTWEWDSDVRRQLHTVMAEAHRLDAHRLEESIAELLRLQTAQVTRMVTHPLADESGRYRPSQQTQEFPHG